MRTFSHFDAQSTDEAVSLLAKYKGKAKLNAGGTDLLPALKTDILREHPKAVINVKTIPGLDHIRHHGDFLKLGALARLSDIAQSRIVLQKCPVLAEAALSVASPQVRNVATVGGNICQDVRCWYYRYPSQAGGPMQCLRKGSGPCFAVRGDNRYHAIMKGRRCFAVCPSDTATALAALDGRLSIKGPKGERSISVTDFFHPLGNNLEHDEMVVEIEAPLRRAPVYQKFLKFTLRGPVDFAVVSVAVAIETEQGLCTGARIALGAVGPGPVRAGAAEGLLIGRVIDESAASEAAEAALSGARPLSNNGYKVQIAKTLVKRALLSIYRPPGAAKKARRKT